MTRLYVDLNRWLSFQMIAEYERLLTDSARRSRGQLACLYALLRLVSNQQWHTNYSGNSMPTGSI